METKQLTDRLLLLPLGSGNQLFSHFLLSSPSATPSSHRNHTPGTQRQRHTVLLTVSATLQPRETINSCTRKDHSVLLWCAVSSWNVYPTACSEFPSPKLSCVKILRKLIYMIQWIFSSTIYSSIQNTFDKTMEWLGKSALLLHFLCKKKKKKLLRLLPVVSRWTQYAGT